MLMRLLERDDRIIRQRPSECQTFPDAAWWLLQPQGGHCWLGTVKWMERHGLIAQSIAPTKSDIPYHSGKTQDDLRQYYQAELRHRVYAITKAGISWLDNTLLAEY